MTLGLEVASLQKVSAMSLPTLGFGTCCLKGEASEEQAGLVWDAWHIWYFSRRCSASEAFPCFPHCFAPQVYQGLKIGYRFIDTVTLAYWCTFSVNSVGKEVLKQFEAFGAPAPPVASLQGQPLRQRGQRGGCYPTSGSATWGAIPGDEDLVWRHGRENHRGPARIFEAGSKQWDFMKFLVLFSWVKIELMFFFWWNQ